MPKKILTEILNEIKSQYACHAEVWTAHDIAHYMRLSVSSVQSRIITRKDFPRPVRIPTSGTGGGRRWYAAEVKNWLRNNREPHKK